MKTTNNLYAISTGKRLFGGEGRIRRMGGVSLCQLQHCHTCLSTQDQPHSCSQLLSHCEASAVTINQSINE